MIPDDKITISTHQVRKSTQTVLTGFHYSTAGFGSAAAMLTHLKKKFATGGHITDTDGKQQYALNGDKKRELLLFIMDHGVKKEQVVLSGLS